MRPFLICAPSAHISVAYAQLSNYAPISLTILRDMCPFLRTYPSQTSIASISDKCPDPRILSIALLSQVRPFPRDIMPLLRIYPSHPYDASIPGSSLTLVGSTFSLPLYACVGLLDNETPIVKCVLMTYAPILRTHPSQSPYTMHFF